MPEEFTCAFEGFPLLPLESDAISRCHSPEFCAFGASWRLELALGDGPTEQDAFEAEFEAAPRGKTTSVSRLPAEQAYLGLFIRLLAPKGSYTDAHVVFRVGSREACCEPAPSEGADLTGRWRGTRGVPRFLPLSQLRVGDHFVRGALEATATLRRPGIGGQLPCEAPTRAGSLASDLEAMLRSGTGADVVLRCGGESVAAHSQILCARSAVFAAQLKQSGAERAVPHCPAAATLPCFAVPAQMQRSTLDRLLLFLYSDDVAPCSTLEAESLCFAAAHYQLPRLLQAAGGVLVASLCVDNAAHYLALGDQHGCVALKSAALRLAAQHTVEVMETAGWAQLTASRPRLAAEVLRFLSTTSRSAQA